MLLELRRVYSKSHLQNWYFKSILLSEIPMRWSKLVFVFDIEYKNRNLKMPFFDRKIIINIKTNHIKPSRYVIKMPNNRNKGSIILNSINIQSSKKK